MDDMQTFEREIAGVIQHAIGPARTVDAMAVTRAAATQSPKWRFRPMLSAIKFVVAGVIVALFGGFLLSGVLTQQPSDEMAPAAAMPSGPGTFAPTGPLVEGREGHTATLLPDGRVFVVGGSTYESGDARNVAAAEIWDPASESFSPTGSLAEARWSHTATLLPDGRVLVIGGSGEPGFTVGLTSAELWDPETGSFAPTGSLAEHRGHHTATLLPDGRVLVIGGVDKDITIASAEIWDPASGSFIPAGTLTEARFYHTATVLPDGRVLVVGGMAVGGETRSFASAEVWDPATESFSPVGSLAEASGRPTASNLPDGRVIVVSASGDARSAEVWDPATESFSPAGSPLEKRNGHTATLLPDGRVLVVGGWGEERPLSVASAEVWDPATESFSPAGSLSEGRVFHAATVLLDGRVLVIGGSSAGGETLASAEVWSP